MTDDPGGRLSAAARRLATGTRRLRAWAGVAIKVGVVTGEMVRATGSVPMPPPGELPSPGTPTPIGRREEQLLIRDLKQYADWQRVRLGEQRRSLEQHQPPTAGGQVVHSRGAEARERTRAALADSRRSGGRTRRGSGRSR